MRQESSCGLGPGGPQNKCPGNLPRAAGPGEGGGSRLRAWFQAGPSRQPVWAGGREPDICTPPQLCPNSLPAPPRCRRTHRTEAKLPLESQMTSALRCSKEKGVGCVCAHGAPAPSRGGCRPGFRGMQHLASCEPEPDVHRPDVGHAPLGGGCTGGSHNLIVRPNPEHITLEYVHRQQHCHKKRPQ